MLSGIEYLGHGFKLLFKPGLKRFVLIPLFINICLFIGLFLAAKHYFILMDQRIIEWLPAWLKWLNNILWVVFFLGFLFVSLYMFTFLANLISAPFNNLLAEKVEWYLTGNVSKQKSLKEILQDFPHIMRRQFSIIGYYIPRAILFLICFFIPILQIAAALLWFLFNAWWMTLQYLDYPTDNHGIPLNQVHTWMRENRLLSLSFGTGIAIASMIPLLNFLVVPAAVAGATKLWVEKIISQQPTIPFILDRHG